MSKSSNAIHVIFPYREQGTWVFDDERVGLVREPFVSGVPEMIDRLVAHIPDATRGFKLLFSDKPFPGAEKFTRLREEFGGNWYRDVFGNEGWLCPALFLYYPTAPEEIFVKAEKK
jgi:hypothetical protein